MARFVKGRPVTTTTPFVTVDTRLKVGAHRFQLMIVDKNGVESLPAVLGVTIVLGTPGTPGRRKGRRKKSTRSATKPAVRKKAKKTTKKATTVRKKAKIASSKVSKKTAGKN